MDLIQVSRRLAKNAIPRTLHPQSLTEEWIARKTNGSVFSGPFAGMRYVREAVGSRYFPKILGTYEKELHPLIEKLSLERFDVVANVGAGEGYYAVGFAWANPRVDVEAYEATTKGQELIREMSRLNAVENRVFVHGTCGPEDLNRTLFQATSAFVMMDVEGGEIDLLNPTEISALRHAHILVEVHNFNNRNTDSVLEERFRETHRIHRISAAVRTIDDFPIPLSFPVTLIPRVYFEDKMGERLPGMSWLFLEARDSSAQSGAEP